MFAFHELNSCVCVCVSPAVQSVCMMVSAASALGVCVIYI